MQDALGDRMKDYEKRFRVFLPRRAYTLIRLDGKAFHTFTRGFDRPFDEDLIMCMDETAKYLCENIQGAKVAYVQSDEITILLTDFDKITTSAYFDGNIQKIASITASMASTFFNKYGRDLPWPRLKKFEDKLAFFDSRCWSLSDPYEVENTFIWRQNDAVRNSVQLVAQSLYSHKELHGKNQSDLQEMIFQKGQNWNDYPVGQKRGRAVVKRFYPHPDTKEAWEQWDNDEYNGAIRSGWEVVDPPTFTQDRMFLRQEIPVLIATDFNQITQ